MEIGFGLAMFSMNQHMGLVKLSSSAFKFLLGKLAVKAKKS